MGKKKDVKSKSVEKSLKNFIQEKMVAQKQEKQLKRLEHSRKTSLRAIDNESYLLKEELASFGRGMTSLDSYFKRDETDIHKNTIWFPLKRSASDWEPKPCWLGKAATNEHRCSHFPCRNINSYHFIFRELPQWILDEAEVSVRNSKIGDGNSKEATTVTPIMNKTVDYFKPPLTTMPRKPWNSTDTIKLPPITFPEGMTANERKLKIIIEKKRRQNELENKPLDRCINYGKPTPIRQLQRPVRPIVRQMDNQ